MKKHLLLLFAALLPLVASAEKVKIDGIWYNLTAETREAEVTFKGDSYDSYWDEYPGSITIPATVTYGGVTYSVTSIGNEAFADCSSLTAITIPEGVTSIGGWAFADCSSLTAITIPEGVTSIGDYVFQGCSSLTAITLPESVTSIGFEAFRYCSSLTAITIPEGVTSIGVSAFSYCSSLTSITIPESVTSIGSWAFWNCSSLTSITIPESVTSIGEWAFCACSLTAVTIPEGVTSIGGNAFSGCTSLTAIVVAEGNKVYDSRGDCNAIIETSTNTLHQGCSSTIIPESVTSIGNYAFYDCSSLTAITIPESVTSIGWNAFEGCSSLTAITIPEGVMSIGKSAFSGCTSLTAIVVAEGNKVYDSRGGCNAIIETSTNTLHQGCSSTIIPESVTSIGFYAFYDCSSLTAITIPESVTSIGGFAFSECTSLTDVYCYAETVPSTELSAFDDSNIGQATLHVPASALESYKATEPWSRFGTIVALTDEEMGVEQLTIDNAQLTIYDLSGRRVATPTKDGIYIVNGRKVMVKIGM